MSIRIIRRRMPAGVAWAWLFLILFVPIIGTLAYMLFGEYRQPRRRIQRLNAAKLAARRAIRGLESKMESLRLPPDWARLAKAISGMSNAPTFAQNEIRLLPNAERAFAQLIQDINSAKKSVDLEFYIWSCGGLADQVAESLVQATKRGVTCRLLVDAVGSSQFIRSTWFKTLTNAGVRMVVALPAGFWRSLIARPDLRIHRKIIIIDGDIAYTGSMNLADPKFFKKDAHVGQWVDAMARVRGPIVEGLQAVFASDWCAETSQTCEFDTETPQFPHGAVIQCLASEPAIANSKIEQAVIMSLYSAQNEIVLTTPYFVPSESLLYALTAAASRGVHTTLIVPERVDSKLTHYASRSYFQDLIAAGVRVALFRNGLLHTKSITIDGEYCLFGSLNLDPRSLRINFEISLGVFDKQFTKDVCELQNLYLNQSKVLSLAEATNPSRAEYWQQNFARLLAPLL